MKRISKRTRKQAALICAIAASGGMWLPGESRWSRYYANISIDLDEPSNEALHLAVGAYHHVMRALGGPWTVEVDAEAEALLRTGWSP